MAAALEAGVRYSLVAEGLGDRKLVYDWSRDIADG